MTFSKWQTTASAWLQKVLAYSIPSASLVFVLFKWAGNSWLGRLLNRDLEKFKCEQQELLERFKTEQQKEIERLKHLLSSRVSSIHEKEFEVLPKAWLMLNELRGSVAHAVGVTITFYPDFPSFSPETRERFLCDEIAAGRLDDDQASDLRRLETNDQMQRYYMGVIRARNIRDGENHQRLFVNYLHENRIFLNADLRKTFKKVQEELHHLLRLRPMRRTIITRLK
jgi:hypothetical protein